MWSFCGFIVIGLYIMVDCTVTDWFLFSFNLFDLTLSETLIHVYQTEIKTFAFTKEKFLPLHLS